MEQMQSVDQKQAKLIPKTEEPEPHAHQHDTHALAFNSTPHLSLDHNPHSLALGVRTSIENGIPIPRNMLSHSDDPEPNQEEDPDNDNSYPQHRIKGQVSEGDKEWVDELGLNELLQFKKVPSNTKNVLRNFGNAQNQYILYHRDAQIYVQARLTRPESFYKWIRSLKLEKFENFKEVWSSDDLNPVFRRVYRELCFKFYHECAIPYVLSSRMKNENTKLSHLRYIYRFIEGIKDPYEFSYFKKIEK